MANHAILGFEGGDAALELNNGLLTGTTTSTRFSSGRALSAASLNAIVPLPSVADVYMGVAINCATIDTGPRGAIQFLTGVGYTIQCCMSLFSTHTDVKLGAYTGAGSTVATASLATPSNTWFHYQIFARLHASTGRFMVIRDDGATILDYTGNTLFSGSDTAITGVQFVSNAVVLSVDDLYINDGTGPAPYNDLMGDLRVAPMVPTGVGATTGMTPSTGANWQTVDEQPYVTTDYVTGAAGTKDTYATSDAPASATVFAIKTKFVGKKTDAGALSARTVLRSGGTDYVGTTTLLGTSDIVASTTYTQDPATSAAWTLGGANAIEIGVEAVA